MKKTIYLLLLLIAGLNAKAQQSTPFIVNSMGGTATINNTFYDWSFGEMLLVNTFSTPNLIVTQGVLQPESYGGPSGINTPTSAIKNIKIYPNPSQDIIYIQSDDKTERKFQYTLMDVSGKILTNEEGEKTQTINLSGFPAGMYMLKITVVEQQQTLSQTYKIQKIN